MAVDSRELFKTDFHMGTESEYSAPGTFTPANGKTAKRTVRVHYKWYTGDEYRGGFKHDKRHGKGTLILSSQEVYEASWEDGKMTNEPV
jgi:hypothetical protein